MVILGVCLVCAATNLKCSIIGWPEYPTLPVTLSPSLRVVTAANAMPWSITCFSMPSRPQRKSRCHQERRNSPSVTDCRPTSSCFLMTRSISRSSISLSAPALISPLMRCSRAFFSAAGRNRLPTWSARNGGLVRMLIALSPYFLSDFRYHFQLRPLLVLSLHVALLDRGEAALRRQAKLIERYIFCGLVDAPLDFVARLKPSGLRGHQTQHKLLLAFGKIAQRLEPTGPLAVIFQEIAVEIGVAEQLLGDEFVAALRDPGRAEITAAGMHGDRHVGRLGRERRIGDLRVDRRQRVGIVAARLRLRPLLGVAHHRPSGVLSLIHISEPTRQAEI